MLVIQRVLVASTTILKILRRTSLLPSSVGFVVLFLQHFIVVVTAHFSKQPNFKSFDRHSKDAQGRRHRTGTVSAQDDLQAQKPRTQQAGTRTRQAS
jgi:hypothetical protein